MVVCCTVTNNWERLNLKGWMEKDTQANINQKKGNISRQVSDKVNFKASSFTEWIFSNDKGTGLTEKYSNSKFVHSIIT